MLICQSESLKAQHSFSFINMGLLSWTNFLVDFKKNVLFFLQARYFHQIALLYNPDTWLKVCLPRTLVFLIEWAEAMDVLLLILCFETLLRKMGDLKSSEVNPLLQWSKTATGVALLHALLKWWVMSPSELTFCWYFYHFSLGVSVHLMDVYEVH